MIRHSSAGLLEGWATSSPAANRGRRLAMGVAGFHSKHDRSTGGGLPLIASFSRLLLTGLMATALMGYANSLFALNVAPDSPPPVVTGVESDDSIEVAEDSVENGIAEDPTCGPRIPISHFVFQKTYRVTAYCDSGITAAGIQSGYGQCAAPADIPFGARIYVPEIGQYFIVTDRTHRRFRHNTIDLFIPSKADCLQFGRRTLTCEVELPGEPIPYASPALSLIIAKRWP